MGPRLETANLISRSSMCGSTCFVEVLLAGGGQADTRSSSCALLAKSGVQACAPDYVSLVSMEVFQFGH
jgi:hypothetical protein